MTTNIAYLSHLFVICGFGYFGADCMSTLLRNKSIPASFLQTYRKLRGKSTSAQNAQLFSLSNYGQWLLIVLVVIINH